MSEKKKFRAEGMQLHPRGRIEAALSADGELSASFRVFLPYGATSFGMEGETNLWVFISESDSSHEWITKAYETFRKKGMEPIGLLSVGSSPQGPTVSIVRPREYIRDLLLAPLHVLNMSCPPARAARIETRREKYWDWVIPVLNFSVNFEGHEASPMDLDALHRRFDARRNARAEP